MEKVVRTEAEWRDVLSPAEYHVLRQAGTERAFLGEYTDTETVGVYKCRACGAELFRSEAKFHSGCGWPSFYQPTAEDAVTLIEDRSHGMLRVEARCARCDSHLGHVFTGEGYGTPTDERWCINSISLTLEPKELLVARVRAAVALELGATALGLQSALAGGTGRLGGHPGRRWRGDRLAQDSGEASAGGVAVHQLAALRLGGDGEHAVAQPAGQPGQRTLPVPFRQARRAQ
jgi:peptide-methionine (R)-S-oxide reductase